MRKIGWLMAGLTVLGAGAAIAQSVEDPYLWLEEWTTPRAMAWVESHNAKTTTELEADPRYAAYFAEALTLAQAKDRLPGGNFIGGKIYNFWQDADHVRGLWRRTSVASFASPTPAWETVIDLDKLAADEKANWVWKGAACARPAERRCLVELSDGGEDAVTVREYDLVTGTFVPGGFTLPKGKQEVSWESENSLLVSREWEPGQLTNSGYAYVVKRLKRGQPLSAATEIYRGQKSDVATSAVVLRDAEARTLPLVVRGKDFYHNETYMIGAKGVVRLGLPEKSALHGMVNGRVIVEAKEDWRPAGSSTTIPAGSLVALDLAQLRADPAHLKPTLITTAGPREALEGVDVTRDNVVATMLDNVRGRLVRFTPTAKGGWRRSVLKLPDNSSVGVADTTDHDNRALVQVTSFLVPPSQWFVDTSTGAAHEIRAQAAKFDASNLVAEQHEAVSSDGMKIPYFLVHRRDMPLTGNNPTLLYAYGGFEQSMTPSYSSTTGKLWLEKGGVFALANIRGGGEFGPKWHEAGLGVKRQIIYDDFAVVGRDLIARRVTSPRRLGIRGGSNGGLLTGVQFVQHPELWNAVIIEVPLLDMIRISKIAAGASWEGEYGSVENDPAVRAFWDKTSPYQNLRRDGHYPQPFIFTTTKDDRVGPQHARKFAARMEEYGLPFYYYENTEGGHAAGANLRQAARTNALEMIYLTRKLMDPVEPGKGK
ncbi:prolyl oligopeptidase family serine peptidase [Sphingomonas sp. RB1R13]|uniref:prolyl oligopeptidase family serine peptidase n=1 Tax=Sphingomonas sp. RB1R13 TaxID=3096159 RepID=UPI002FC7955E